MSQPELIRLILRWGLISLMIGAAIGLFCGVILFIRQRFLSELDSVIVPEDFLGRLAVVTLPFGLYQLGQVRLSIHGQVLERQAKSFQDADDDLDFRVGDVVLVVDIDENSVVQVIPDSTQRYTLAEAS